MKYLITLLFCFTVVNMNAQKIENLEIEQKGGELSFQYDLNGSGDDIFKVSVLCSANNQDWKVIDKVYGDVGDSILPGTTKKFVVWVDHIENVKSRMYFKVLAEYYTVDQKKEGNITDKIGYTYNWVRYGKTKWMTQNIKSAKTDGNCGGYFNNSDAGKACPDNWQLPTDKDWMALEVKFGVKPEKVKEHGLREINLTDLSNTGFFIEECNYNVALYPNQKALAFWTSSENKMLYTGYSDKYFARIIRLEENKISKELRDKTEELNVRCVQSSIYLANIEAITEISIDMNPVVGLTNHPFTGQKLEWRYIANNIWLKNDIKGSYLYKESTNVCPTGWRMPVRKEWDNLLNEFNPSVDVENKSKILHDRLSTNGVWSFNLTNNDYWMTIDYYTYNTYWINKNDKADSRKLREFLSNKKGLTTWTDKQANEKAKVRCLLDSKDFINKRKSINSGTFIDTRDNKEYGMVKIDGTNWMSENLKFDLSVNSTCRDNIDTECKLFGHMYNIEVMNNGCPDGWRLPTSEEWKYILINKAANNLKILYPFGGTGFNLLLGGEVEIAKDEKTEIFTANYLFVNEGKAGYYHIDSKGKVELNEKAKKKDYYYVRCIKK